MIVTVLLQMELMGQSTIANGADSNADSTGGTASLSKTDPSAIGKALYSVPRRRLSSTAQRRVYSADHPN
jgi:hypothetical protein